MKYFRAGAISVTLHVLVIAGLLLFAAKRGCLSHDAEHSELTVAFDNVEVEQENPRGPEPPKVETPPEPDEIPIPQKPEQQKDKATQPKPEKPPEPPKNPKPQPIEKGNRVIRKPTAKPTEKPSEKQPLTPEEIADALNNSVNVNRPKNPTPLATDERSQNESLIASVLYKAWAPPSREASTFPPPTVGFFVRPGGRIDAPRILKSSGNDAFDKSALDAVRRVGTIPGLSDKFITECQKEELKVEFKLRD